MKNKIKYIIFTMLLLVTPIMTVFAEDYTTYIVCGPTRIPEIIPSITRVIVKILQLVVPIVLIIFGSLDFAKAVMSNDSEKIKNGQKQFIRRIISAAIFFFVVTITMFIVEIAANVTTDENKGNGKIADCINCMINDESKCGSVTSDGPFLQADPK